MTTPPSSRRMRALGERVLVVDDEDDVRRLVVFNLTSMGFTVDEADTGKKALALATAWRPSVVVLDLMLPDVSGSEVCRRLRDDERTSDVGVIMLTARGDEYDRVLGFEVGADDYVSKPFSVRELVMRVATLCAHAYERRVARSAKETKPLLSWGGLAVDPVGHRVTLDGVEITLRPIEYRLLVALMSRPGVVMTRADLLREVWGLGPTNSARTIHTNVRRLRERLGRYAEAIDTVHGFGYRLREPPVT